MASLGWLWLAAQLVVVVDGDTLKVDGERVRLIGIDAAEIRNAACAEERRRGERAKAALETMVNGKVLELRRDGRDRYGRTLAVVLANGRDVGAALIAAGHAVRWTGRKHDWCG